MNDISVCIKQKAVSYTHLFNDVLYALLSMEAKVKESIAKYCLQQADLIQSRIDSNTERSFHDSLDIKAVAQYMNLSLQILHDHLLSESPFSMASSCPHN